MGIIDFSIFYVIMYISLFMVVLMKNTYRTWFVRFYVNDININLKSFFDTYFVNYAYILHDKDVYTDNGENHIIGELKKEHYHAVLVFENAKSLKSLSKLFFTHIPNCGLYASPTRKNSGNAYIYLTHSDSLHKYQYSASEIVTNDSEYFLSAKSLEIIEADNSDWTLELFNILLENNGRCPSDKFIEYARKYGRDFILNCSKVLASFTVFLIK